MKCSKHRCNRQASTSWNGRYYCFICKLKVIDGERMIREDLEKRDRKYKT